VQRLELLVTLTLVQHRELQLPADSAYSGMRHTHFGAAVILLPSGLLAMIGEAMISVHNSARLPRQRDIPRLQVLRYVLGPIRALTDPGSHSEVAELGCRSCCDLAPTSRIETGAFGPAGAQGSLLRRTFRGEQSAPRTRRRRTSVCKASVTHKFEPVLIMHWNK
jgi:hypothetical protein